MRLVDAELVLVTLRIPQEFYLILKAYRIRLQLPPRNPHCIYL